MKPETLEALQASIRKWDLIVKSTAVKDRGGSNCPLCQLFPVTSYPHCEGCPVREKTGEEGCGDSPYDKWTLHHESIHGMTTEYSRIPFCKICLRLAKAERDFLITLLPDEE